MISVMPCSPKLTSERTALRGFPVAALPGFRAAVGPESLRAVAFLALFFVIFLALFFTIAVSSWSNHDGGLENLLSQKLVDRLCSALLRSPSGCGYQPAKHCGAYVANFPGAGLVEKQAHGQLVGIPARGGDGKTYVACLERAAPRAEDDFWRCATADCGLELKLFHHGGRSGGGRHILAVCAQVPKQGEQQELADDLIDADLSGNRINVVGLCNVIGAVVFADVLDQIAEIVRDRK